MKQIYVASYYRNGYRRFMKYILDVLNHPKRESIEKRLEIIQFFDEFGAKATRKAFTKGRSTIYLWKQKLKKAGGKLSALAPEDKTPIHKRRRIAHPFIESFIIQYRRVHPGADKTTIAPALDVRTGFAFTYTYKSNSSANGSDFFRKFTEVAPFVTKRIQTDNSGEFEKHFAQSCQDNGLVHFFNYPKHSESNCCLERFNRTIQESFP